jgi:hypothetical protein
MTRGRWKTALSAAAILMGAAGILHAGAVQPSQSAMNQAVSRYLVDHGDLCLGKFAWPRVVTPEDRQARTNDAVQLPVLERLGLVKSTVVPASTAVTVIESDPPKSPPETVGSSSPEPARSYALTTKGQRYHLLKRHEVVGLHGEREERDQDLCVARLSLDRVVKWTPPEPMHGTLESAVHYTYHVQSADWMADPDARRVFPVADRIIRGQGNLLMSVNVQWRDGNWVPVLPGR